MDGHSSKENLNRLLDRLARSAHTALIWNMVLESGVKEPESIGVAIVEMLESRDVLTESETQASAAALISVMWPNLDDHRRATIEQTILRVAETGDPDLDEALTYRRDALLGCIPDGKAITPEAQARIAELKAQGDSLPQIVKHESVEARSISKDEWLQRRGTDLDAPANKEIRQLTAILKETKPAASHNVLSANDVETLLPTLLKLHEKIRDTKDCGADKEIVESAVGAVYDTAERMARSTNLSPSNMVYQSLRSFLIEASQDPRPLPDSSENKDQNESMVAYGSGQPRIEAAQGLMHLARNMKEHDHEVIDAIRRLASDPHWAVRFQIRSQLNWLWVSDRKLMWELIEQCAKEETYLGVLRFFAHTLVKALRVADSPCRSCGQSSVLRFWRIQRST